MKAARFMSGVILGLIGLPLAVPVLAGQIGQDPLIDSDGRVDTTSGSRHPLLMYKVDPGTGEHPRHGPTTPLRPPHSAGAREGVKVTELGEMITDLEQALAEETSAKGSG